MEPPIEHLIASLIELDDGLPCYELVSEAEKRGWVGVRHANALRNAWTDLENPLVPTSERARVDFRRIRHDIMLGYLRELSRNA